MLSLMDRALEPSSSYCDKIMFMSSIEVHKSICSDNSLSTIAKLQDLVSSTNTRFEGLQALEIAIKQNPDVYLKGNWTPVLTETLKESGSYLMKECVCNILSVMIPYMAKDVDSNLPVIQKFLYDIFPLLLDNVDGRVEWIDAACKCILECLKSFPQALHGYKDSILGIILKQVSYCVSSKTFEILASCFCQLPSCMNSTDSSVFQEHWLLQYQRTLNTMLNVLNSFLTLVNDETCLETAYFRSSGLYCFEDDESDRDVFPVHMKAVRRFINLSKCLSKMLSTRSKLHLPVPIKATLTVLSPLFSIQVKLKAGTTDVQVVCSYLAQIQIAGLLLMESITLNFSLLGYSSFMTELIYNALQQSYKLSMTTEAISHLRHAVLHFMTKWLCRFGGHATVNIVNEHPEIVDEILKDIAIEDKESSQASNIQTQSKSKKNICISSGNKHYGSKNQQLICKEALKALESLIYTGATHMSNKMMQDIYNKVVQISSTVSTSYHEFPFPYDHYSCRKQLYSVLLAIVLVSKPDERGPSSVTATVFSQALKDDNIKVIKVCNKALATCRSFLHPKRPPPEYSLNKQKVPNTSDVAVKFSLWSSQDYVRNAPDEEVKAAQENASPRIEQTFHNSNEGEIHSEEYMEVDHYRQQSNESLYNGEDIIVDSVHNSSQCQEDESEDEDEEDEDEERSYGEEEMNQEEIVRAEMCVTSSSVQVLNPVLIDPETVHTVDEPEYEELRPATKAEDNVDTTNRLVHLNGMHNIVADEHAPSVSTHQIVANENGIVAIDDDDEEEEDEEEDEEDEQEENTAFPAEKRVPEFRDSHSKKQKLDTDEEREELQIDETDQNSRPLTLEEMKADFCCNDVDDEKS